MWAGLRPTGDAAARPMERRISSPSKSWTWDHGKTELQTPSDPGDLELNQLWLKAESVPGSDAVNPTMVERPVSTAPERGHQEPALQVPVEIGVSARVGGGNFFSAVLTGVGVRRCLTVR